MPARSEAFYLESADAQASRLTELAAAALERWPGAYDELRLVKHRENAVFSARRDDGRRVALRVHRHAYHSDAALFSELSWMQALSGEGILVPQVMPTHGQALFTHVAHPAVPETRQVDMLGWLDGAPIGSVEEGLRFDLIEPDALFRAMGELAARLHSHSNAWSRPAKFVRHAWDEEGLIGPDPFWGRFWELPLLQPAEKELLQTARARATRDLAAFGKAPDRFGLIHADFAPENLLHCDSGLVLIDFDDCGFGWHMFELATVLFLRYGEADFDAYADALFRGYRQARTLPPEAMAALPLFLFLRGTTYLGWIHTRFETEFARALAPSFIERACRVAADYLTS